MKIMIIVGARPNFMKAGPILKAIAEHNRHHAEPQIQSVLVHTGQHYDSRMSDAFFADLDMPQPDVFLGAGSGSHAVQTAEVMKRFEDVVMREWPEVVLVVGDVNSTAACALVTSKLVAGEGQRRPLVVHVEAGLRSFDRDMPEEINRIVTDHLSDLLFITEESGLRNLEREGIPSEKIFLVGNTMIDSLMAYKDKADHSPVLTQLGLKTAKGAVGDYVLLTLHRPANVDNRDSLLEILEGLKDLAASHRIIFPAHPRTQKQIQQFGLQQYFDSASEHSGSNGAAARGINLIEPQGYLDFLCLMKNARIVVTDSGGIQEETTALGVPCVTVRDNTERPVTVDVGSNILAGTRREGIREAIRRQLEGKSGSGSPYLWDGKAAARIVEILARQAARPSQAVAAHPGVPAILSH